MRITPENFFNHYIIDPLSKELSLWERMMALGLSILLTVPTLGILHIRAKFLQSKNIVNITGLRNERLIAYRALANSVNKVSFAVLQTGREKIRCTTDQIGKVVHERFIQPFYAKPLPSEEQVTVPYKGEWKRWQDLTRSQKIEVNNTGTREHNQLPKLAPEAAVNRWFFAHGQAPFLANDPRQSHGNDHAARASIFAAVFAYLYQKYHPDESVDKQDMMIAQIVAAGHDSGRQTEGPDVYDSKSAENTVEILKSLGVTDETVLHDAHEAIEHKDSDPLSTKKPLIARCVQNADCAEFSRLLLSSGVQDAQGFENSKAYLDIYKELKAKEELKEGRTFKQFEYELDALRKEMNDLIFQTHKQDFRSRVATNGQNIYEAILQTVTPIEFPLLYEVLTHIGVKEAIVSPDTIQEKHTENQIRSWIDYGVENIPIHSLEKLVRLSVNNEILLQELQRRNQLLAEYHQASTLSALATAYGNIPEIDRNFAEFQQKAQAIIGSASLKEALTKEAAVALLDLAHSELKALPKETESQQLVTKAQELIDLYKKTAKDKRSNQVQTTIALILSQVAERYINEGNPQKAKEVLSIAANELQIEPSNKFYDLKKLLEKEKQGDGIVYEQRDTCHMRKRKLGCQEKTIDGKHFYELSFEIPRGQRQTLEKQLQLLVDPSQKEVVDAKFYRKSGKEYVTNGKAIEIGEDLKITLEPGVEILIGNTKQWWTHYHYMRIRVDDGVSIQKVHSALAKLGMPMALMPSRDEDILTEMRARSIAFRYPDVAYKDPANPLPAHMLYEALSPAQKAVVDKDCENIALTHVGNGHFEHVIPTIAEEAWKLGVRSVATFVWAGTTLAETTEVVKNIIKNGLMSSQERFQHGIIGLGCCPHQNYRTGSANEYFTRILTKNLFEDEYRLDNFAIEGRVFVMLDPRVLERMPYSYTGDRNGVRNPDFYLNYFHAQKQGPIFGFRGDAMMKQRLGFEEHVNELYRDEFPLNETMFDLNVGANYIQKLVLTNKSDRIALIAALQKAGVYELGGRPIEEAIVTQDSLKPELVRDYYEENPYKELRDGAAYI